MNKSHSGIGMTSLRTRRRLINRLKEEGIKDPKVLEAILNTPRHLFVEEALAHRAYEDVSLPIGYGQTISQPYIVARMSELLIEGGNVGKVLEVGTGSGYQTAILSQLVSEVVSLERIKALHDIAGERLHTLGYDNVALYFSDGFKGSAEYAPFDGIIVTAAPHALPQALLAQLSPNGGRMVIPVGDENLQYLLRVTRRGDQFDEEKILSVRFVPLLGGKE